MISPNQDTLSVLGTVIFPVYSWAILHLLYELPAWTLYLSPWELVSGVAYVLSFALLECFLVLTGILVLTRILPKRLFGTDLVPQATLLVTLSTAFAIVLHYSDRLLREQGFEMVGLLGLLWITTAVAGVLLVHRSGRARTLLGSIGNRFSIFSYIYVPISIISFFIVVLRNLTAA